MDAWNWVTKEIRGEIGGGEWLHAESLGAIAGVFARTPALVDIVAFRYISPQLWLASGLTPGN